ncbi:LysE family translocator [Pandoraea nosoerga]|uniref:Amino acid efflux pump, RhtB family protein n=1 Tax=Pandoraea nosoerga TaxID=2508296 RepID=A0A5E4U6I1_9BURK|nr:MULTISPECIES: LysE family translocator [Pandoraea]MBN4668268.1 LysE family translocator [Pandoraea nosoerga]MBN4676745.1 LysE family translocator [Pandoraea nosoerga]MBN4683340.1 LysE family translocator [Pandoraea nosoerga]MBN4747260.1 LysE family translocator [Pandoraea nosoerga]VVD95092.1 amino acid efflux pump, RhtB family protein [Pandoraea nosoerga]
MVSLQLLTVFVGALIVVYALPGPDMALVMQTSMTRGVRHGLATALGLALARAGHVILSACGVAALLRAAPWLFETVRIAGALYLAWIAIQIWRSPVFGMAPAEASGEAPPLGHAVRRGVLSSVLNPKALLFCSVLLPQFVRAEAGAVWTQVLELGVLLLLVGAIFDVTLAFGAARIAHWLRTRPFAQKVQRWSFAAALMAFAVRLSLD